MSHSLSDAIPADAADATASTLPPEFAQLLTEQSPYLSGPGFELIRTIEGRHSELLEFSPRHVLVKRITKFRDPAAARATVVREFDALKLLTESLDGDLRDSIPRPLFILPDARTLVLGCLQGTPLLLVLKRDANRVVGLFRRKRAYEAGTLVGRWLRRFHDATGQPPLQHDHATYLADLSKQLERCENAVSGAAEEVRELASRASEQLHGQLVPCAARHGDFIPQNILIDDADIRVVDFENFRERDVVYQDAGTFVAYLTMLIGRPFYSATALRALTTGFLSAYGQGSHDPVFGLHLLKAQVTNAAMFRRRQGLGGVITNIHSFRDRILRTARTLQDNGRPAK